MRNLLYIILLACCNPLIINGQCDVELSSVNWETGDVQIVVHNSDNCGIWWGVPWIDHINLGISNGIDTLCIPCQNFPLHSFLNFDEQHFGNGIGDYGFAGDTLNFNLADASNANISDTSNPLTVYERWMEWYSDGTFCEGAEIFIWQINYSNAPQALNPDWYNPFGTAPDYPDVNPWDNILPIDGLCPCDPIYIYETDTIVLYDTIIEYVDVEWIVTDTVYITEVDTLVEYVQLPPDTVQVLEYVYDTLVLVETDTIVKTEYIYITETDTVTIYEIIYIDCYEPCDESTIFVPNTVTPNGDGINDVWGIVYEPECFSDIEIQIYNRWGEMIWSGYDMEYWYPDVSDGVYVYRISISGIEELVGHITVIQ